ncbi:MAG: hypothetical protein QNK37_27595 [Acidobacteriota bacterium]|nr:hypothetical protein [Acidobacteriota bacterium]
MPDDKQTDSENLVHQFLEASREQAGKNAEKEALRRSGLRLALGLTVVSLVLAVFSFISRQGTIRQMERTELRRAQAEQLIEFMLTDLKEKLDSVGRLDVLENVGAEAMAYFETLSEAELTGDSLARKVRAMHRIGEVRYLQNDKKGALEIFDRALSNAKALAQRDPLHSDWHMLLVTSYFWMANVHQADYNAAAGLPYCEAYQEVAERMYQAYPDDPDWQFELTCAYQNMTVALRALNRIPEALEMAQRNTQLARELWEQSKDDLSLKRDLADSLNWRGILFRHSDISAAVADHKASVKLLQEIAATEPKNMEYQTNLQDAQRILAKSYRFDCRPEQALNHDKQALETIKQLVAHDPTNADWSDAYTQVHVTIAYAYGKLNQWDLAEEYLSTAHEFMMSTDYHSQVTARSIALKKIRNLQARKHLAFGDHERAFNLTHEDTRDVKDTAGLTPEMREIYISNLIILARASLHVNRSADAVAAYEVLHREAVGQEHLSTRTAQALEHVHEVLWGEVDNPSTPAPCY